MVTRFSGSLITAGVIAVLLYAVSVRGEGPEGTPHSATVKDPQAAQESLNEAKKTIVARVNGAPITLQSLTDMMSRLGSQKGPGVMSQEQKQVARKEALDRLITDELAYQKGRAEGMNAEPAEVDKAIGDLRTRLGGEEAFAKTLVKIGLTDAEVRADIERNIILRRVLAKEVFDKITISEDDVRKEYEREKTKYVKPEQLLVTDVVFFLDLDDKDSVRKAGDILTKILEDKDRNPLSLVPDGTFIAYDTEIKKDKQPELYEEARKLKAGELSGVIRTSDSFHIIKLKEYNPEKQIGLDDVRGFVKDKLTMDARRKALDEWGAELRKSAKIEIMETQENKK